MLISSYWCPFIPYTIWNADMLTMVQVLHILNDVAELIPSLVEWGICNLQCWYLHNDSPKWRTGTIWNADIVDLVQVRSDDLVQVLYILNDVSAELIPSEWLDNLYIVEWCICSLQCWYYHNDGPYKLWHRTDTIWNADMLTVENDTGTPHKRRILQFWYL